jgi:hypothetical protein
MMHHYHISTGQRSTSQPVRRRVERRPDTSARPQNPQSHPNRQLGNHFHARRIRRSHDGGGGAIDSSVAICGILSWIIESIHDLALKMLGDSMIGFLRALERTATVTYRMTVGDPSSFTGRHDLVVRAAPSGEATSTENPRPIRQMPDSLRNLPAVLRPDTQVRWSTMH